MFHVLLAADGNAPRVLEQAEAVAALPYASEAIRVSVLHVFEDTVAEDDSDMLDPRRVQSVTTAEEYLTDHRIEVDLLSRAGETVATVLSVADEIGADGIFVGGPKRSPAGKAVFGSTAQQLILNADIPVTVTIDR